MTVLICPTLASGEALHRRTVDIRTLQEDRIALGPSVDLNGDEVSFTVRIDPPLDLVQFNEETLDIDLVVEGLLDSAQKRGLLKFQVTLSVSDFPNTNCTTTYYFQIEVPPLIEDQIGDFYANLTDASLDTTLKESDSIRIPGFSAMSVSNKAQVKITFSEKLIPRDPKYVTNSTLDVKLHSNTNVPPDLQHFTWNATKFDSKHLWLQLDFESPLHISSETMGSLDMLEVEVRNPFMFRSSFSDYLVPINSKVEARIPP